MKLFARILTYNWRYYAAAILTFMIFWQLFSVFSAVRVADDKLKTSMRQNAADFEKAFLEGDVFETQRIMWRIKNEGIKRISFTPIRLGGSRWIFKEAVVGTLYRRPWGQIMRDVPFVSNGATLGSLEYVVDLADVSTMVLVQNYLLFITVVAFFLGLLVLSNMGAMRTLLAIERSVNEINAVIASGRSDIIRDSIKRHIDSLPVGIIGTPFAQMTNRMSLALSRAASLEKELAVSRAVSDIAAQVAHDIRSPLAAMEAALGRMDQLPEKQRVMARQAVNRMRDIANNLLVKNRRQSVAASGAAVSAEPMETCLLLSLMDAAISEKRLQLEAHPEITLDFKLTSKSYGIFGKVQSVEFGRIVSNLLNNAAEALEGKGSITLTLSLDGKNVFLRIADSGRGIPENVLLKLGQKGETYGKAGGSGLGLYHAKTTVESWGGRLEIRSEMGKGTEVVLTLPAAKGPDDFVSELKVPRGGVVAVLDDDPTTHQLWDGRFASARLKENGVEVRHFNEPDGLRRWVRGDPEKAGKAVCLFDYELMGYKETGLSLAEELGLCGRAILVTSRSEEKRVMDEARRLKMRIIPKGLADFVPLSVTDAVGAAENCRRSAVLIDDDALVHMNWSDAAGAAGVDLKAFTEPSAFMSSLDSFSKDIPIYIDSELGNGVKGEDIAAQLKEKGFTDLTLETGHGPERFAHLPWLKVRGKESPWKG